jgi:hypothetical protein
MVSNPTFLGPPGRHLFKVQAALKPSAWIGLYLELSPD